MRQLDELQVDGVGQRSPARIKTLSTLLANQIAAGEVVERPASVVKELIENSLDAGARRIHIDVEQGGVRLIRVRDDGCGIHHDDMSLALNRHATSKIDTLGDLERVTSMGFRGEALPSIASVSRLTLISTTAAGASGWRVSGRDGSGDGVLEPASHPPGTTVEVRDLFFNTPARRKFLRSERTEFLHLENVVKRAALSRPEVAIALTHNQREVLAVPVSLGRDGRGLRIGKICGASFVRDALGFDLESGSMRLEGRLLPPDLSRASSDRQYFFVNGRMVRDKLVTHAVRQAYQNTLPQGRHPAYVLYLRLDPAEVDVNVHPAKHEVRFRDARTVHDFVLHAARRALSEVGVDGNGVTTQTAAAFAGAHFSSGRRSESAGQVRETLDDYSRLGALAGGRTESPDSARDCPLGRAIGVLDGRYLLAENVSGLVLVDAREAQRRLLCRRMTSALRGDGITRRPVLMPVSLSMSEEQVERCMSQHEVFARLGVDLRRAGPEVLMVREVPALLGQVDVEAMGAALIELVCGRGADTSTPPDDPASVDCPTLLDRMLRIICSFADAAVVATWRAAEVDATLRELEALGETEQISSSLWTLLSLTELEQRFPASHC